MSRIIPTVAALLLTTGMHAQDVPPSRDPKTPDRNLDRERQMQGNAPMAGSPQAQWDDAGTPFAPDTAFASILLDHSQLQRIQELDRRNGEELQRIGTNDRNDPRYTELWARRSRDIRGILTPVQYERWKELNAGNLKLPPPAEMVLPDSVPTAQPDKQ